MSAQGQNITRVFAKIAPHVVGFCKGRLTQQQPLFHMEDLESHVRALVPDTAPDSPSRILRSLRQQKWLDYVVRNRRDSLYEVLGVGTGPGTITVTRGRDPVGILSRLRHRIELKKRQAQA